MRTLNELPPAQVFHPGEDLRDELEARGLSVEELSDRSGIGADDIRDIIAARRSVAPFARRLEGALNVDAEYWAHAQEYYDMYAK